MPKHELIFQIWYYSLCFSPRGYMIAYLLCWTTFFLGIVPTGAWDIPRQGNASIDPSIQSYEIRKKTRVDYFDFSGEYTNLKNIDIDGKRLKEVEMTLTGNYPLLEKIQFEGGLGSISAKLTGTFPELKEIDFLCNAASLELDLSGKWDKECHINLTGSSGILKITLPKDIGIIVSTKAAGVGKVAKGPLKKKGWGVISKNYVNELYEKTPITLHIDIVTKDGKIVFQ